LDERKELAIPGSSCHGNSLKGKREEKERPGQRVAGTALNQVWRERDSVHQAPGPVTGRYGTSRFTFYSWRSSCHVNLEVEKEIDE